MNNHNTTKFSEFGRNSSKKINGEPANRVDKFDSELFENENYLNLKMDVNHKPCDNFYEYACGNSVKNVHKLQQMEKDPKEKLLKALGK